jgi:hypothetical protein
MGDEPAPTPTGQEPVTPAPQEPGQEPVAEPKKFDEAYVKQLRAENAAARKARQDLEAKIAEFEERDKSELEKLTGKITKAEQRAAEAEAKLLRFSVAQEKEVPARLVQFLTATTREDLEAQAAAILENLKPADPDFDPGVREPAGPTKTPAQEHDELVSALFGAGPAAVGFTPQSQ